MVGGACAWLGERSEPTCSSQAHAPISRGNMKGHLGNIRLQIAIAALGGYSDMGGG